METLELGRDFAFWVQGINVLGFREYIRGLLVLVQGLGLKVS